MNSWFKKKGSCFYRNPLCIGTLMGGLLICDCFIFVRAYNYNACNAIPMLLKIDIVDD